MANFPKQSLTPSGMSPGFQQVETLPHIARQPYGIQSARTWTVEDIEEKAVIDALRPEYLWRASAFGENLLLTLTYGSMASLKLPNIRLPFEGFIPGQVGLMARKLVSTEPASCRVTFTAATGGVATVRMLVSVGPLLSNAKTYTALTASTLTVAGIAGVAVAPGQSLPLVAPSAVTAGTGILELIL